MKVVKRLNNNAVLCLDSGGRSVVAFGKGIAFAVDKATGELPLAAIERTFYNLSDHYLALLDVISPAVLTLSAEIVEMAALELPYDLSPNAALALADHLSFALERAAKGIIVRMPLSYDIVHLYPAEYKVATYALDLANRRLNAELPDAEAAGIALCLLNASLAPAEGEAASRAAEDNALIEKNVQIVERRYGTKVDREGFEYARFATHLRLLLERMRTGEFVDLGDESLYETVRKDVGRSAECLDEAAELLEGTFRTKLSESEKHFILLHIMRVSHPCR